MSESEFLEFAETMNQEVLSLAADPDTPRWAEDVFVERVIDILVEAGEIESGQVCGFKARGQKVSGYSVGNEGDELTILVAHCEWNAHPVKLWKADCEAEIRRAVAFVSQSLQGIHEELEESTEAYDLARLIFNSKAALSKMKVLLVTDCVSSQETPAEETLEGVRLSFGIWDMERIHRSVTSGGRREDIEIDFEKEFGGPLTCLEEHAAGSRYSAYFSFVAGETLAKLYEKWGTRLLERNVRAFLQAKGQVNRGIRATIQNEPQMFLAYNNGIAVVCEGVETRLLEAGGLAITKARGFQIVNGGQTTASLYYAKRMTGAPIADIRVPMKVTVIRDRADEATMIHFISLYSNTQNKINHADFSANERYHVELEARSRTIWAPDPEGGKRQTRWFYERARGQYWEARNKAGTPSQTKAWDVLHPKNQVFTKTDLAKYENAWAELPHLVSRGAQANFVEFTERIDDRKDSIVTDAEFRQIVARAIIWKGAERVVTSMKLGGYRANVVAYTIALVSMQVGRLVDLETIWERQRIGPELEEAIRAIAGQVYQFITHPPGGQNITQWCKKEECWTSLRKETAQLPTPELASFRVAPAKRQGRSDAGILPSEVADSSAEEKVRAYSWRAWTALSLWGQTTGALTPYERQCAHGIGRALAFRKPVPAAMAGVGIKVMQKSLGLGFKLPE